MRKIFTLSFLIFFTLQSKSQTIFFEDFDGIPGVTAGGAGTYTFPTGWFLRNVDNRTTAASVSYVNEAWERREDFQTNVADSCAFSTSWYEPGGSADDWMWTPAINIPAIGTVRLSWNAKAYDPSYKDGYEVRIMTTPPTGSTGTLGNMVSASTLLYSNTATGENSTWTSRETDISAYAGQTVYIGFRNNSNDKFILVIDDILVENVINFDATLVNTLASEYTMIPLSQSVNQTLGGRIRNDGLQILNNVRLKADLYRNNTFVETLTSSAVPNLAAGNFEDFTISPWSPADTGTYIIKYYPAINETDQNAANDTITKSIYISDSIYARDDGIVTGTLGIGAGNGGFLGQQFDIKADTKVRTITAYFTRGYTGRRLAALIWNTDAVTGKPTTVFAATDTLIYPNDDALLITIPLFGGQKNLPVGKYVVTAIEFAADSTLTLGLSHNIFTENKAFVSWPTIPGGGWQPVESFGIAFRRTFILRLNLNDYGTLPVKIISFTGAKKQGGNQLNWAVAEQSNIIRYEIERSTDGRSFTTIGSVLATTSVSDNYMYFDGFIAKGPVFYRLRVEEKGQTGYSRIIRFRNEEENGDLSVWPNPAKSIITIQSNRTDLLNADARLVGSNGKVYKQFIINQLPFQLQIQNLPAGVYFIQVLGKAAIKFIKQ